MKACQGPEKIVILKILWLQARLGIYFFFWAWPFGHIFSGLATMIDYIFHAYISEMCFLEAIQKVIAESMLIFQLQNVFGNFGIFGCIY